MGGLRFEAWTLPWSGSFERVIADIPVVVGKGKGSVRFNDFASGFIAVPSDYDRLTEIISATVGTMIRAIDGTTIIQEFLAERVNFTTGEEDLAVISGDDLASAFDRAIVYPFDYPASPTLFPNHIWAGANVLTNPGFENNNNRPTIFELYNDGAGGDTFTITDGTDTTSAIAWDATATTIETRMEADITAYDDVKVSGAGTPPDPGPPEVQADPWVIEFVTPVKFSDINMSVTDTGMTSTLRTIQFGAIEPSGWTKSQTISSGVTTIHGDYTNFFVRTNNPYAGTSSLFINPPPIGRRYAGAQQVPTVKPGGIYQASIRVRPESATNKYRFILRGIDEDFIASDTGGTGGTSYTADTYTEVTIADVIIPDSDGQIIFRLSNVDATGDPAGFDIDAASLTEGAAAATVGTIVISLMDDASSDHSADTRGTILDWIDYSGFDATNDSTTTAWDDVLSFTAFRGEPYGSVFDRLRELGYEWTLTPKATPAGGLTHDLNWYNKDAAGTDHTSSATPAINVGQSTTAGPLVRRIPRYTAVLVEGEGGGYTEDKDGTAETNFGRLETYEGDTTLDSTTRAASATQLLAAESENRIAVQVKIVRNDNHPIPLVHYSPGDLIDFQFPPELTKTPRRVQQITWRNTEPPTYRVTGSRIFEDEAGGWEALRKLLRKFTPLIEPNPAGFGAVTNTGDNADNGAHIHLIRAATQTIAVDGEPISWDQLNGLLGVLEFADPSLPVTKISIPIEGYYNVSVQLGWDSFTDGGEVWVERTRNTVAVKVWPPSEDPGLWTTNDGQFFEGESPAIPCQVGDLIAVYVDHDDVSTQTLGAATLGLYLVHGGTPTLTVCPVLLTRVTASSVQHDAFPGFVVAEDDTHVVAYREGDGHTSTDGVIKRRLSTDGGVTWGSSSTVLTNASFDFRGASLTRLDSGTLVMVVEARDNAGANVTDGGFTLTSTDDGATWGAGIQINDNFTDFSRAIGPVTELANGDWLLPVFGQDSGDSFTSVRVITSDDSGATWSNTAEIADGETDSKQYNEAGIVRAGGDLLILIRENTGGGFGYIIHASTSTGTGGSWSSLRQVMNKTGGAPKPFLRSNGDVVVLLRDIQDATTIPMKLMRSPDFGISWERCQIFTGDLGVYGQPGEDLNGKLGLAYAIEVANDATSDATLYFQKET